MKNCLRDVRRSFDITQEELAKAVGTTRQTIHKIERGKLKRAPSYELMYAIAQFFGKKVVLLHSKQTEAEKKTAG